MPDWLLWGLLIVLAVAAGWGWSSWRRRAADRPARRPSRRPGRGAPTRAPTRPDAAPKPRDRRAGNAPRPGDIWWAEVPFSDGTGAKDRPCLVLRADPDGAEGRKITSQDRSDRDDHVRIPTRSWDPEAERDSFLDLSDPIRVDAAAFRARAGRCDQQLWRRVRTLHHLRAG
jgi:hypothetical protein